MIYAIDLSHGYPRKTSTIYAHPSWPFVIDHQGEPSPDFKVLFMAQPVGMPTAVKVFLRMIPKNPFDARVVGANVTHPPEYFTEVKDQADAEEPSRTEFSRYAHVTIINVRKIEDLRSL